VTSLPNRFYHWIRHPAARSVADEERTVSGFQHLQGHKYCLLVTYKRSGEGGADARLVRAWRARALRSQRGEAAKVKRIRNDPRVRVAPCTVRGRPLGPPAEGRARTPSNPKSRLRSRRCKRTMGWGAGCMRAPAGHLASRLCTWRSLRLPNQPKEVQMPSSQRRGRHGADALHRVRRRGALPSLLHGGPRPASSCWRVSPRSSRFQMAGSSSTWAGVRPTTSRRSRSRLQATRTAVSSFLNIRVADIEATYTEWGDAAPSSSRRRRTMDARSAVMSGIRTAT